jgi:hypothetical protein
MTPFITQRISNDLEEDMESDVNDDDDRESSKRRTLSERPEPGIVDAKVEECQPQEFVKSPSIPAIEEDISLGQQVRTFFINKKTQICILYSSQRIRFASCSCSYFNINITAKTL